MSSALAVFDLDGTITRHDTLAPFLFGYLKRHPWRVVRLPFWALAPVKFLFDRNRTAIKGAVIRAVMGGAQREAVDQWAEQFVKQLIPHALFAEALSAIHEHRERGDRLLLMSASTDLYVPRIAKALGFDQVICSEVRWLPDGRLDGRLATLNCQGEEKRRCLAAVLARDRFDRVYAYGNAGSDLLHMTLAHEAFLVNGPAHPKHPMGAAQTLGRVRALRWQQPA